MTTYICVNGVPRVMVREDGYLVTVANVPTPEPSTAACQHPAARNFAWFARDDTAAGGQVLCIACCDCGAVLQGAASQGDQTL